MRLRGINFPNRESFLFLDGQFGSSDFKSRLEAALISTGSAYGRAMAGLVMRGGAVIASQFAIATGLPTSNAKGHLLHSVVEDKLQKLGLVSKVVREDREFITHWSIPDLDSQRQAVMMTEDVLLAAIQSWTIKMGWSSKNTLKIRNESTLPKFGQFAWDMVGPSYLSSLVGYSKGQITPGFIVADVVLERMLTLQDLKPFFAKWDALRAQRRSSRFQPMLVTDAMESDTLNELRKRGAIVAVPAVVFGETIAGDLRQLMKTLQNAAAAVAMDPQRVFDLINRMLKLEGAALNLRGVVIEMLIAHLYKLDGYEIDIRQQIIAEDSQRAEIDIKARNRKEVICCECKGKAPLSLVDAPEIKKWLDVTVPRIKSWLNRTTTLPNVRRFEFWVSSDYTDAAKKLIEITQASHIKQPIRFYTGRDVIERLQDQKLSPLVDIFREQFM